jgi:phthalate 4,5-dioxygenase
VQHPAYPCVERGGIVWAYLGPGEARPELPGLEYLAVPESHQYVSKRHLECHWTQSLDGDADSSHVPFLHGSVLETRGEGKFGHQSATWMLEDRAPKIEVVQTPGGLMIGSRRRAEQDSYYWRINHWLMPWYTFIPAFSGDGPLAGHAWVPVDDGSTSVYTFTWHPARELTDGELQDMRRGNANYAELIPGTYLPRHNRSNGYNADEGPSAESPFRRIKTIQEQDMAMTESMGPLYDRTQERLASADLALIQVRRRLLMAAQSVANGGTPPALDPDSFRVRQLSVVLPRSVVNWPAAVMEHIEARPETFVASA